MGQPKVFTTGGGFDDDDAKRKAIEEATHMAVAKSRKPFDFGNPNSIWDALKGDGVALLRGSFIIEEARWERALPRRQECPADAYISLEELKAIFKSSKARPPSARYKRLPIVAISYCWHTKQHPDPQGVTLKLIAIKLLEYMQTFAKYGIKEVGVFVDWSSLYQPPYESTEQYKAFKTALATINLWYAHSLTTVFMVTDNPKGVVKYHDRGWTSFEYHISWLIKRSDKCNIWPQVCDLGFRHSLRPGPPHPESFHLGRPLGDKHFTNGSDHYFVALKFNQTCEDVYASAIILDFDSLSWGNEEVDALGQVLPFCRSLEVLYLSNNLFEHLPLALGNVSTLKKLYLANCTSLVNLPDWLINLPALNEVSVNGCHKIRAQIPPPPCMAALKARGCHFEGI